MEKESDLHILVEEVMEEFKRIRIEDFIISKSIPILWFGNYDKYINSRKKIITVSLNPSGKEFKPTDIDLYSPSHRFRSYSGTINGLVKSYNEYFQTGTHYKGWFNPSFKIVLESFDASYNKGDNVALHTDIGSPFATNPAWSNLSDSDRKKLEPFGAKVWHSLIEKLSPDIILFSASAGFQSKIKFPQIGDWISIDVKAKRPLLVGKFEIRKGHEAQVLFQVQGRKPFLQTSEEEKVKFSRYLSS